MIVRKISDILSDHMKLVQVYALAMVIIGVIGVFSVPGLIYDQDQLYPKTLHTQENPLYPYDRGGEPFSAAEVHAQYPENSPYLGYVTGYLTPLSKCIADHFRSAGTTIVSHPGGIIDEILYNTRGLDTIVETSVLFVSFTIAAYLFRRRMP